MKKWWLRIIAISTPLGFLAVEAGWTVTEVGRQPWIIYGVMRTKDAVSSMPGLKYSLLVVTTVYLLLSLILVWLMRRQINTIHEFYPTAKIT
jgi:cytochrome d ubiquinol oxidase subunit I